MGNTGRELAKQAKKQGICSEWHEKLKGLDSIDELAEMYLKGIDFCLSNDFPPLEYMRDNVKGKTECHGIYIDGEFILQNPTKVVALGDSAGEIRTGHFGVCEIFIKNNSKIELYASGDCFVMVDLFQNGELIVNTSERAKVCVNRYGGEVKKKSLDNSVIKIIQKQKSTY